MPFFLATEFPGETKKNFTLPCHHYAPAFRPVREQTEQFNAITMMIIVITIIGSIAPEARAVRPLMRPLAFQRVFENDDFSPKSRDVPASGASHEATPRNDQHVCSESRRLRTVRRADRFWP